MENDLKTPPHSAEAERGVLGAILLDTQLGEDSHVLDACLAKGLTADSFYDPRHKLLFDTLSDMSRQTMPIDAVTLNERLRQLDRLDAVGGVAAVEALVDATPTTAHAEYYIDIVRQKHLLRCIIERARNTERRCFSGDEAANADLLLGEVEKSFLELGSAASTRVDWKTAVDDVLGGIERAFDAGGPSFDGLSTGFTDLDNKIMGMKPADMIVVAARPSVGKTSLAMNIAECVAMGQNINGGKCAIDNGKQHPVLIFSLEMSTESLAKRMLCGRAGVPAWRVSGGMMSRNEKADASNRLAIAAQALKSAPIWIDDTSGLDVMDMRARARRMHRNHGIELIVIDYLQLCNCREYAKQGRQLETSRISNQIKAMAKELKVPVIVLSQLSRANEQRGDKTEKPKLSDLRDSGAIEQDADVVFLLRRPCRTKGDPEHDKLNLAIVDVAKQRNGSTGDVRMNFHGETTRFNNRDKSEDEDQNAGGDGADSAQPPPMEPPQQRYVEDPLL